VARLLEFDAVELGPSSVEFLIDIHFDSLVY
jgi:hypothetical protein